QPQILCPPGPDRCCERKSPQTTRGVALSPRDRISEQRRAGIDPVSGSSDGSGWTAEKGRLMTYTIASGGGDVAENISQHAIDLVDQTSGWMAGNAFGILIAAGIGTAIAVALLTLRSLAARILRQGSENVHWRIIFARAVARTRVAFIILCAAELVTEHANT